MGDLLIASLADGLLLGFVYGIAAMGLSLIWGVMDVINLAHGSFYMVGAYVAATVMQASGDAGADDLTGGGGVGHCSSRKVYL